MDQIKIRKKIKEFETRLSSAAKVGCEIEEKITELPEGYLKSKLATEFLEIICNSEFTSSLWGYFEDDFID